MCTLLWLSCYESNTDKTNYNHLKVVYQFLIFYIIILFELNVSHGVLIPRLASKQNYLCSDPWCCMYCVLIANPQYTNADCWIKLLITCLHNIYSRNTKTCIDGSNPLHDNILQYAKWQKAKRSDIYWLSYGNVFSDWSPITFTIDSNWS